MLPDVFFKKSLLTLNFIWDTNLSRVKVFGFDPIHADHHKTHQLTVCCAGTVHLYVCVSDVQWDKVKYPIVDQGNVTKVTMTKTVKHRFTSLVCPCGAETAPPATQRPLIVSMDTHMVSETILYKLGKATN